MSIKSVILAAGRGERLGLSYSKVLLEVMGKSIIERIISALQRISEIEEIIVVVGFDKENVKSKLKDYKVSFVEQKELLGTADALLSVADYLKGYKGKVLVLNGDLPLINSEEIQDFIDSAQKDLNLCVTNVENPHGYGRIIRDNKGKILKIKEEKELTEFEKAIKEVNVGIYLFEWAKLLPLLKKIQKAPSGEFYLTDIVELAYKQKLTIGTFYCQDSKSFGVNINTWSDFAYVIEVERLKIIERFLENGVRILMPSSTYIEEEVQIGEGTVIYPFTVIEKNVVIGRNCSIGPFARLRSGTKLGDEVIIGNFMELKNTTMGNKSKARHLSYLGDAIIGSNVNIGAGTITANYDGKNKNTTIIGDNSTTGSGAVLVAPVKIGKNCVIGAGAVVTKNHDVEDNQTVVGVPARPIKNLKSQENV
jgi:bifunctional UDP-N-acetylglucosamine pyrophosphorylase/glucosamine-1-phosphate N-acetyltransferase